MYGFRVVRTDETYNWVTILTNARHVKIVPGHKTDKKGSAWLSKLLLSELLEGCFIPPRDIRDLRDLVRYRKKVVGQIAGEKIGLSRLSKTVISSCRVF